MSAANVVPMLAGIGLLSACCISSSVVASVMGGGETPEESTPTQPTEYVYDFIVKEQSPRTNDFNIHITDIEADGVRVTPEQLTIHEEPEHAKCNSKANGYECEGDIWRFWSATKRRAAARRSWRCAPTARTPSRTARSFFRWTRRAARAPLRSS